MPEVTGSSPVSPTIFIPRAPGLNCIVNIADNISRSRHILRIALGLVIAIVLTTSGCRLHPRPVEPGEAERSLLHKVTIESGDHTYTINVGGKADDFNSLTPSYVFSERSPAWQLNRQVTIRNIGDTIVQSPLIHINSHGPVFSMDDLIEQITDPIMNNDDKARAVYEFVKDTNCHATVEHYLCHNPLFNYNALGFSQCDENASVLAKIFRHAKFNAFFGEPLGHSTTVCQYDGLNHFYDGNMRTFFLMRDNRTVADERDIALDPDLVFRNATSWPINVTPSSRGHLDLKYQAIQFSTGNRSKPRGQDIVPPLPPIDLRPGESLIYKWEQNPNPWRRAAIEKTGPYAMKKLFTGSLYYHMPLEISTPQSLGVNMTRLIKQGSSAEGWALVPESPSAAAIMEVKTSIPTVLTGGEIRARFDISPGVPPPQAAIQLSSKQIPLLWTTDPEDLGIFTADLAAAINATSAQAPLYRDFTIRLSWPPSNIKALKLLSYEQRGDFQITRDAMPSLKIGINNVRYTDKNLGQHNVEILHEWVETDTLAPPAPPSPIGPSGTVHTLQPVFTWKYAQQGPAADRIHIQVFNRSDLRWPLSNAFDQIITLKDYPEFEKQWTPHRSGLLSPGHTCWWRIRARSPEGIWSDWSQTLEFTPEGPVAPENLAWKQDGRRVLLTWRPGAGGTKPEKYEIHADNQYGFTAYTEPYHIKADNLKTRYYWYDEEYSPMRPPSLAGTSRNTEFVILHPGLHSPEAQRRVFCRVVAVDAMGARSDSSEMIELPHPWLITPESIEIKEGMPVKIPVLYTSSLGRFFARQTKRSDYDMAFWKKENVSIEVIGLPDWLHYNAEEQMLEGTPPPDLSGAHIPLQIATQGTPAEDRAELRLIPVAR